jgi:4-hydroxy-tetrahydrodipicolinate synthase
MPHALSEAARGTYIIAATPFAEDGAIDWASVDSLIEFYIGHGVDGITILGMMGEAQKLSEDEAIELIRHVLRRTGERVPVVVGISNAGTDNLVKLGKTAMEAGAAGVMVAPSPGLKTEMQIIDYFGQVIGALGQSTPVVYQDYPQSTGVNISIDCLYRLVDAHPSLVMLKHEDCPGLRKLSQLRARARTGSHRRISVLVGNGGLYLPQELRRGADGAMTGFAFPEVLVGVCRLFAAGRPDAAEDLFDAYLPLVRHEAQPGIGLAIRKEVLRRRGAIKCAAVRLPGPKLDAEDGKELDTLLERLQDRLSSADRRAAE